MTKFKQIPTYTAFDKIGKAYTNVLPERLDEFKREIDRCGGWIEDATGVVIHGKKPRGTIDLTPTWKGVLPLLLETYASGNDKGRALALAELQNMAKLADLYNAERPD